MYEKLKSFLLDDHIFFGLIMIVVAIASFALGRASVVSGGEGGSGVQLINSAAVPEALPISSTSAAVIGPTVKGSFVASKAGTKYHLTSCPGAKQIREENKIYFSSKQEALAAGYKPAANCPGLQ